MTIAPSLIRPTWLWDDPAVYRWTFQSTRAGFRNLVLFVVGALVAPPLFFLPFWALSLLAPRLTWWFSCALMAFLLFGYLYTILLLPWKGTASQRPSSVTMLPSSSLILLCLTLVLLALPGSAFAAHFKDGAGTTPWQWLLFYYDNLLDVVTLGSTDLIDFHLTTRAPDDTVSRTLATLLRTFIGVGIIGVGRLIYRMNYAREEIYGTIRDCYRHCRALISFNTVRVRREARVEDIERGSSFLVEDIIKKYNYFAEEIWKASLSVDNEIYNAWGWNDDTVYRWEVEYPEGKKRGKVDALTQALFLILLGPVFIFAFFWALSWLSPALARWSCLVCFWAVLFAYVLTRTSFFQNLERRKLAVKYKRSKAVPLMIVWLLLTALALPGSTWPQGFTGAEGAGLWRWLLFMVDNTLDPLLAGIPGILNLHITGIAPDDAWSKGLTIVFRLMLGAGAIEQLSLMWQLAGGRDEFYGHVREMYWHFDLYELRSSDAHVARVARVVPLADEETAERACVLKAYHDEARRGY